MRPEVHENGSTKTPRRSTSESRWRAPTRGTPPRLEDDATTESFPVCGALLSKPHLTRTAREEFVTGVPENADPGDQDVETVLAEGHNPADNSLRDTPTLEQPLDACRHLGPVRQRHGTWVDRGKTLELPGHVRTLIASSAADGIRTRNPESGKAAPAS